MRRSSTKRKIVLTRPTTPNLFEIRLPPGDVGSLNIGWIGSNGAQRNYRPVQDWLSKGYAGVRFIGAGVDQTHVRCTAWDGNTIVIGRHAGIVEFENLTYWAGYSRGIFAGEQNLAKVIVPKFQLHLRGVKGIAPGPRADGRRTTWLNFGYNVDVLAEDSEFDATEATEHDDYWHGAAKFGWLYRRVNFRGAGSQILKIRSDAYETAYAGKLVKCVVDLCEFANTGQPHGWRGSGAIVGEGPACDWEITRSAFYGGGVSGTVPSNQRSKMIMLSSETNSYDKDTGRIGIGYGNGDVLIRQCGLKGYSEWDWGNTIIRCARNSGEMQSAKSFTLERSGVWGERTIVQVGQIPTGRTVIRECNTPELREWAEVHGMDTSHETTFPTATRKVPLSEGIVR